MHQKYFFKNYATDSYSFFLLKWHALVIKKQTSKFKENFVILGIIVIKVKKQGLSPIPADILVGI